MAKGDIHKLCQMKHFWLETQKKFTKHKKQDLEQRDIIPYNSLHMCSVIIFHVPTAHLFVKIWHTTKHKLVSRRLFETSERVVIENYANMLHFIKSGKTNIQ